VLSSRWVGKLLLAGGCFCNWTFLRWVFCGFGKRSNGQEQGEEGATRRTVHPTLGPLRLSACTSILLFRPASRLLQPRLCLPKSYINHQEQQEEHIKFSSIQFLRPGRLSFSSAVLKCCISITELNHHIGRPLPGFAAVPCNKQLPLG
jgi:hypothetical protein